MSLSVHRHCPRNETKKRIVSLKIYPPDIITMKIRVMPQNVYKYINYEQNSHTRSSPRPLAVHTTFLKNRLALWISSGGDRTRFAGELVIIVHHLRTYAMNFVCDKREITSRDICTTRVSGVVRYLFDRCPNAVRPTLEGGIFVVEFGNERVS